MPMGTAEIVASLKELCEGDGPKLTTERIVEWVEHHHGYESHPELVAYAKKMKARQFARMLMFEDEETGKRVKRLWSFKDPRTGDRHYHDIAQLDPETRRKLVLEYARFQERMRAVRKAMADYFAGQGFFSFYLADEEEEEEAMTTESA